MTAAAERNFAHAGASAALGMLVAAKLVQYAIMVRASACDGGASSGPSNAVVFEKRGNWYVNSAECAAPISIGGVPAIGGGAARSPNSY